MVIFFEQHLLRKIEKRLNMQSDSDAVAPTLTYTTSEEDRGPSGKYEAGVFQQYRRKADLRGSLRRFRIRESRENEALRLHNLSVYNSICSAYRQR
jgi:hypothetical protein